jgi:transposase
MKKMKTKRARYTLEYKQEAVRLVESGQIIAAAARSLGMVDQTLFNWVKASREGRLQGADSPSKVSAEHMEISRLRAELARVRWSATSWKKRRRTSRKARNEVRLYSPEQAGVADQRAVRGFAGERRGLA